MIIQAQENNNLQSIEIKEEKQRKRIPLVKLDSNMRYVDHEESEWSNEFRKETTKEYERMLYIELPSLINKIINTRILPTPVIPELIQLSINEIEKITEAECRHIVEKYREYIK